MRLREWLRTQYDAFKEATSDGITVWFYQKYDAFNKATAGGITVFIVVVLPLFAFLILTGRM